ncbi:MAG TPA: hypothetical protein P5543_09390 [Planctomycetota bacterium]|nr:hypothetical protein [Planctomycetota bacterium]
MKTKIRRNALDYDKIHKRVEIRGLTLLWRFAPGMKFALGRKFALGMKFALGSVSCSGVENYIIRNCMWKK